ncbi:MFS quinate transporter [Colletotrichum camelliae]|nr:MFS quinate transporter [Colletotrichum camelliae]
MRNIFSLQDDPGSDTPKEVYGYRPYLLAFSASWASAMYGYDSAFIGGTINLPSFQRAFGLGSSSADQIANLSSNIVSTFQAGAFFGCIAGFFSAERFGRKPVILGSAFVFIIGVVLQLIRRIGLLYGGRALTGLAIGASSTLIPVYIAECSPALIRGRLVGIFEIMLQTALVFGFWVNYGVAQNISSQGNTQWHMPVAVQFVPAVFLITMPLFCSESPRWLVTKNGKTQARNALSWVRNLPEDHEFISLHMEGVPRACCSWYQMARVNWGPAHGIQNLTVNAINYYSPTILRSIGFSGTDVGLLATGVYGIVKMMTTLVFMMFFVDKFGRRPALLIGAIGAMVAMFYLAGYSALSGSFEGTASADAGGRAALAMIYIYAIFTASAGTEFRGSSPLRCCPTGFGRLA